MKSWILANILLVSMVMPTVTGCKKDNPDDKGPGTTYIPPSTQVTTGNAADGWEYLRYGNFIGGGIPYSIFTQFFPADPENLLGRTGDNATVPRNFNAFLIDTVKVVGGITCFGCHSAKINGQFVAGLGNSFSDFTDDNTITFTLAKSIIDNQYGPASPEAMAFSTLHRGAVASASYIVTPFVGVNPAFMLEEAAVSFRLPADVAWQSVAQFNLSTETYASDVPPLWNVKKKHALYYNGMGRGDFTKLLMQVTLVGISDSAEARQIHSHFDDVLAWIQALDPPVYPQSTDAALVAQGKTIFEQNCAKCHGFYGTGESYPNLLVDLDEVGTDPYYARYFVQHTDFANWFNASWLASVNGTASLEPGEGYMAPPLDGIWATAPYLHNGSVPTLEDLLNSIQRPTYWRRTLDDTDYNWTKVGWNYTTESGPTDIQTYNTTHTGYGNGGHTYGDVLSNAERTAVIEYLKTL